MTREEFEGWWAVYPRKVGKLAAQRAYVAARRLATAEELVAGVERYRATKPAYQDWCHPKTWLSQGRWMDEEAEPQVKPTRPAWASEPDGPTRH